MFFKEAPRNKSTTSALLFAAHACSFLVQCAAATPTKGGRPLANDVSPAGTSTAGLVLSRHEGST
eukprot:6874242-Lingulodinium_polyedra.AAC.1